MQFITRQHIVTSNPDVRTTLCYFGVKVTRTILSFRSIFGANVMKILELILIEALEHMLRRTNSGLTDVICVSQKSSLLRDLTQSCY